MVTSGNVVTSAYWYEDEHALIQPAERPLARATTTSAYLRAAAGGLVAQLASAEAEEDRWGGALHRAAQHDHAHAVRWLLSSGARSDDKSSALGHTALHAASHLGHAAVVDALLAAGAAPEVADKHGRTALHHAAAEGGAGVCVALLAAGASPELQDKHERTPLVYAQRGAATAMGVSRQRETLRTVKVLEAAAKAARQWFDAVRRDDAVRVGQLLAAGQLVEARRRGRTALHEATRRGCAGAVAALLAHGADVRRCEQGGACRTPLHNAAALGDAALVAALLRARAPADARDAQGCTALELARGAPPGGDARAELLGLLERAERRCHLRRRWRLAAWVAGRALAWHRRAAERAYAPGGGGFEQARADFEERRQKAPRVS